MVFVSVQDPGLVLTSTILSNLSNVLNELSGQDEPIILNEEKRSWLTANVFTKSIFRLSSQLLNNLNLDNRLNGDKINVIKRNTVSLSSILKYLSLL